LSRLRLVPIVEIDDAEDAEPLADALAAGGLPCAEITFRTAAAAESLRRLGSRADLLLGAGTVLSVDQAKQALDAGARFVVTPGVSPAVLEWCRGQGLAAAPGVATPTDVQTALSLGFELLKFFPAEAFGGLTTLGALAGPFPGVRFVPTGGIKASNLRAWLEHPRVVACGGSWLAKRELIRERRWDEITRLTREAVAIAASAGGKS
jgi:2-dehydro-3-deoxyphosphogluconate aldolase/(4S)-4-hydroxy-2-oxoglutarate aldolase